MLVTTLFLCVLSAIAGAALGLLFAATRPAVVERARALLRTGGVGEEK